MNLIIKIAWRNILRHKGKSIVIGVILFIGALLMTLGNGVISGMDRGLRKNIVNGFTGDIVLVSDKQESDNVFLEFMGKAVEPIYNYVDVRKALELQDFVKMALPIGKNTAMILNEDGGMPGTAYVIGVDFARYQEMFPGTMRAVEGALADKNEKGVLLPTWTRKIAYDLTSIWFTADSAKLDTANLTPEAKKGIKDLSVKPTMVFMGFNNDNTTTDVRVGIKGVIRFNALNTIWGHFVLMDIESYRQCLGYFTASEKTEIPEADKKLLAMDNQNLDAMFSDNSLMVANGPAKKPAEAPAATPTDSARVAKPVDIDAGAYNLVLVSLKDGARLDQAVAKLNKTFTEKKLGVRAVTWKKAMGMIGSMAMLIKGALFVFVMFLFFVAIIIIVNTLSMAALERTTEIGMMRAVGARKSFISRMFFGETAMLAAVFGGAGVLVGIIAVNIATLAHVTSDNDMVQLLFGGDTLRPLLSIGDIGMVIIQLTLVTLIAMIYPIRVARSITPLDAISRD